MTKNEAVKTAARREIRFWLVAVPVAFVVFAVDAWCL